MAKASIINETRLLPEPVTAFRYTTLNGIIKIAIDNTRTTGTACSTKSPDWPYIENNHAGNRFINMAIISAELKLNRRYFIYRDVVPAPVFPGL